VLISHDHFDHYVAEDIAKVARGDTVIVATADVVAKHGSGQAIKPGQTTEVGPATITATAAYNIGKEFHPQDNEWVGFIIEISGRRIYYAGDTDQISEMDQVKDIDLALVPVGGTYTMTGVEAASAVNQLKPRQALPYHWGDIVGTRIDAEVLADHAQCNVEILEPGQSLTV
jgi:L-ascorbate metabolism protein UlaG (beta-lactamase superfamily)